MVYEPLLLAVSLMVHKSVFIFQVYVYLHLVTIITDSNWTVHM